MKITKIDKQLPRILITKGDSTDNLISFLSTVFVKNIESKIELNTKKITFDEKMVESIIEIINVSIKEIKSKTNDEMVGIEKEKKIVEGMVVNFINKCSYEPISMIHFINQIFIRILKGHYFINGNKRIAIMTLRNVLFWSGYYLKFNWTYSLNTYKRICEQFVETLQNKNYSNLELQEVLKIKNWIEKHIIPIEIWKNI